MLRSTLEQMFAFHPRIVGLAAARRAAGKGVNAMTLGQLIGVADEFANQIRKSSQGATPDLFSETDKAAWGRILTLRNEMTHNGPGFLDSVDLNAGRKWRRCEERTPRENQAAEIFRSGNSVCRSKLILEAISQQGYRVAEALAEMDKAEHSRLTLREISAFCEPAINDFYRGTSEAAD
jgi:hypothetical protein